MLVKPVLPAYRHFELVQALTDERSLNVQHYLDHECFILGGCMMANFSYLRQGRCHISFVRERGVTPPKRDLPSAVVFERRNSQQRLAYIFHTGLCDGGMQSHRK
ncbi:putative cytoplasmic protein [Salmonella enterica subsp. enterica]|nr:putative cytoplasmic protein [Salmonella enterica subsp. enterica]